MKKDAIISFEELNEFNFICTHECVLREDGNLDFSLVKKASTNPSIYLWLSPVGVDKYEILYVGKAGFGVSKRLLEHKGGFKNSKTGEKNKVKILEKLKTSKVFVYTRVSPVQEVFGVKISTYSLEEEAFCIAYDPLWNRQKFNNHRKNGDSYSVIDNIQSSGMLYTEEFIAFFDALNEIQKQKFNSITAVIDRLTESTDVSQKIVRGYSSQAKGYNGTPMLVYAKINPSTNKALANSWIFRVPFDVEKEFTVILHDKYRNPLLEDKDIEPGQHNNFMPKDLEDFLKNPYKYISKDRILNPPVK